MHWQQWGRDASRDSDQVGLVSALDHIGLCVLSMSRLAFIIQAWDSPQQHIIDRWPLCHMAHGTPVRAISCGVSLMTETKMSASVEI